MQIDNPEFKQWMDRTFLGWEGRVMEVLLEHIINHQNRIEMLESRIKKLEQTVKFLQDMNEHYNLQ